MRADYKNWMPKGLVVLLYALSGLFLVLSIGLAFIGFSKPIIGIIFGLSVTGVLSFLYLAIRFHKMMMAFDYYSDYHLMRTVCEGVVGSISLGEGKRALDVGCGSGLLTINLAKKHPDSFVIGVDKWGAEYASFSKRRCEENAAIEGIDNISFTKADATALPFEDESFDAVISNYVYHNIPSSDRQSILLESLRVLKKGGSFAIHDIFSKTKYKDMDAFVEKLQKMGYQKVELVDTTQGLFFKSKKEAKRLMLQDSKLLKGIK